MSTSPLKHSSVRATVIFWIMTALFVVQMGWWITYQILHGNEENELHNQVLELNRYLAIEGWREHTSRLADSLRLAWRDVASPADLAEPIARMRGWHTAQFESEAGRSLIASSPDKGSPVGRMHIPVAGGTAIVSLDAAYATQFIADHYPGVLLEPVPDTVHAPGEAIGVSQLSIEPQALADARNERRRRIRMFVGEGSFFVLLIVVGAVVIHRALRRGLEFERRQQNFLAAVTHELKAPLASIRLLTETLATRRLPDDKREECLERIGQDVERLQEMIDNTLEAGVYSRRPFHPHFEERNLSDAVRGYVEMHRGRAERAGLELTDDLTPGIIARIDDDHLRRAIGAVIENAVKYTQLAGTGRRIRVSLTAQGAEAIIRVTDDGVGIASGDQKRVFERFFRAGDELTRRVSGSGLGLFLAREIVQSHGGRIMLASDGVGQGTTVEVRLPTIQKEGHTI